MKILFASSEAAPLIKSGGLGDVAGALPKALVGAGVDCRVILPLYQDISEAWKSKMTFVKVVWVPLAWRTQYCGVFKVEADGVTYYLLDNKFYFGRRGLYGYFDDAERFAFFSKAVLEILQHIDFFPDVIHCNDWQTALIPIFLQNFYKNSLEAYQDIRTLFTIHNIQYQGVFGSDVVDYVFGMDRETYDNGWLQFDNAVNLMKGAIISSSWVSTVSNTYAKEIQTPEYGHKLEGMLQQESPKLSGIINGIDYEMYDPETDKHLFKNYTLETIDDKVCNKTELQKQLGLPVDETIPMIGMVSRLVDHKGLDLVKEKINEILAENVQLVVLGTGDYQYEQMFRDAAAKYPEKVSANITFNLDLAQKIYAGADLFLMPSQSEPCGLSQMISMRYGTVPIVRETGGLKDTVSPCVVDKEEGTGFTFASYNAADMVYVIKEGLKLFQNKEEWKKLIGRAMTTDCSWNVPAKAYMELYTKLIG